MSLDPYRDALLQEARAGADAALAEATQEAAARTQEARERAERIVREATAEGEAAAERETAREHIRARRRARRIVLEAKRDVLGRLRRASLDATMATRSEPAYEAMLARLEALARDQLGPQARLTIDPPDLGGIVAEVDGRRVDYTIAALVDRALAEVAPVAMELTG